MPYTHFHGWSFHTHRRRRKGGEHWRAVRRRQRPWLIAGLMVIVAALVSGGVVVALASRGDSPLNQIVASDRTVVVTPAEGREPPTQDVAAEQTMTAHVKATASAYATITPRAAVRTDSRVIPTASDDTGVAPTLRHIEAKRYMLKLVNTARTEAGARPVVLGDNVAAQLHAEDSLRHCFSGHWGSDGLKPYMRYSLAGGFQSNAENGSGLDYCLSAAGNYRPVRLTREIDEAMDDWLASPGHRRNLLDPTHHKINIGIGLNLYNAFLYQHFEGDYVEYETAPAISDGVLELAGTVKNGARFGSRRDLSVQILYDPPPQPLTRGQLARTSCYDQGRPVASLREAASGGSRWTANSHTANYHPCPDPYDVSATALPPLSASEALAVWETMRAASQKTQPQSLTVPWVAAQQWRVDSDSFSVRADISRILDQHGPGVYTILVWADVRSARSPISQYSLFFDTNPPDTYRDR